MSCAVCHLFLKWSPICPFLIRFAVTLRRQVMSVVQRVFFMGAIFVQCKPSILSKFKRCTGRKRSLILVTYHKPVFDHLLTSGALPAVSMNRYFRMLFSHDSSLMSISPHEKSFICSYRQQKNKTLKFKSCQPAGTP